MFEKQIMSEKQILSEKNVLNFFKNSFNLDSSIQVDDRTLKCSTNVRAMPKK